MEEEQVLSFYKNISPIFKIRVLIALSTFFGAWTIYYTIVNFDPGIYYLILSRLYTFLFLGVGIEIGWHRLIAHRSYETNIWFERFLGFVGVLNAQGGPIDWVAAHRQHHIHSDTDKDPYPATLGLWKLFTAQIRVKDFDKRVLVSVLRDRIWKDPYFQFMNKWWFEIQMVIGIIVAMISFELFLYGYALPMFSSVIGGRIFITYFGHSNFWTSYRTYETKDDSVNSWIWWFTGFPNPTSFHNNHHQFPKQYDHSGEKWWEWDMWGKIINLVRYKS